MLPKVTVIVPTYNSAPYLSDCFDSLLKQSMDDFEIVVIDDASEDNTAEIIRRYERAFGGRFVYRKMKANVGRGGVRNEGIYLAKGKYVTFLDSDDAYCRGKIEIQSNYLDDHPETCAVTCRYFFTDERLENPRVGDQVPSAFSILFGSKYAAFEEGTPSLMARREVFDRVGLFDNRIARGQDTDLMVRLVRTCDVHFIDVPLYLYRQHKTNSYSLEGLRERTESNWRLYKKIIDTETRSRRGLAREFAYRRLAWHVYSLREKSYFDSFSAWFVYLYRLNTNLPLARWCFVGLQCLAGYRLTRFLKSPIFRAPTKPSNGTHPGTGGREAGRHVS